MHGGILFLLYRKYVVLNYYTVPEGVIFDESCYTCWRIRDKNLRRESS